MKIYILTLLFITSFSKFYSGQNLNLTSSNTTTTLRYEEKIFSPQIQYSIKNNHKNIIISK